MPHQTLISASTLHRLLASSTPLLLLDCSFDLVDADAGERRHAASHLPGSHYVHLDRDLAAPKHPAGPRSTLFTGRHPLPERSAFAQHAGRLGVRPGLAVVTFDGEGGVYAARAWWMLRWIGHANVAVLDGGINAWLAGGGSLTGAVSPAPAATPPYPLGETTMRVVDADALLASLQRAAPAQAASAAGWQLLDARAPERFRGETEALDPVAGHIPGASNRFFKLNLQADGCFKPAAQLREEFAALMSGRAEDVVHQCGSGVTACHNLLAMAHAGLDGSRLYPGSWSEWCADPARPAAVGAAARDAVGVDRRQGPA